MSRRFCAIVRFFRPLYRTISLPPPPPPPPPPHTHTHLLNVLLHKGMVVPFKGLFLALALTLLLELLVEDGLVSLRLLKLLPLLLLCLGQFPGSDELRKKLPRLRGLRKFGSVTKHVKVDRLCGFCLPKAVEFCRLPLHALVVTERRRRDKAPSGRRERRGSGAKHALLRARQLLLSTDRASTSR